MVKPPLERDEQTAVVAWARRMADTNQEPRLKLLRCGFEGLRLSMGVRMQCKRQCICNGWPDLMLACPCVDFNGIEQVEYHGLFIELKRQRGGVVSSEQKYMHQLLREQGYRVEVAKGADAAIKCIKEYLGMES